MRGRAKAAAIEAALAGMRQSNRAAAECLARHGATAATDVTGFGLAGHLLEMLEAPRVAAALDLAAVKTYPDAVTLAGSGIASTLVPQNLSLVSGLKSDALLLDATLALLFDPQTSGGLLAGIPPNHAPACLDDLKRAGYAHAMIIGEVLPSTDGEPGKIRLSGHFAKC